MRAKRFVMGMTTKVACTIATFLLAAGIVGCGGLLLDPPTSGAHDGGGIQDSAISDRDGGATENGCGGRDNDAGVPCDGGIASEDAGAADGDASAPRCGDGVVTDGETCDDGNVSSSDGCNASCQIEPGWSCAGTRSVCDTICGDGIVTGSETCDDESACPGTCERTLWSRRYGDNALQQTTGLAVDPTGAAVITGFYQGTLDFGGGPLPSSGTSDVFIAKLDAAGQQVWSRRAGGAGDDRAWAVATDPAGNIVVTGSFSDTIDFGGGPLVSSGSWDVFVVKFDAAGHHLWSKRFGDSAQQEGHSVAIDASGNVVIAGMFWGTIDFGDGPMASTGSDDMFVAKLDADGNHVWSKRFGVPAGQYGSVTGQDATSVAVSGSGDVLVTGECAGPIDFGGGLLEPIGEVDTCLFALDSTGQHRWSKRWGAGNAYQGGASVKVDPTGDVLVTGYCAGPTDMGTGVLPCGGMDVFLGKLTSTGVPIFARRFGSAANAYPSSVATDGSGNILLTGYYEEPIDFGNGPLAHVGDRNTFIVKLDTSGAPIWSHGYGTWATGVGIAADPMGNVLTAGYFSNSIDFGEGALASAGGAYGSDDIFLVKVTP